MREMSHAVTTRSRQECPPGELPESFTPAFATGTYRASQRLSHFDRMKIPFTRENAGEMARRANAAKAARKAEIAAKLASIDANATEEVRITRTKEQLAKLDDMIDRALDDDDAELFLRLVTAKERLWGLVSPKAGVMRPKQSRRGFSAPLPLPQPIDL